MPVLKIGSIWTDARGKEFQIIDQKDHVVWYAREDVVYHCRQAAFLERFKERTQ